MRRMIATLSVASLVGAGAVLAASPGSAVPEVDLGGLPDVGTVTIQSGLPGGIGLVTTVIDGVESTQEVSNNSCDALEPGPVEVVGSGESSACFRNLGFGVNPGRDGLPWYLNFLNPNTRAGEQLEVSINADNAFFLGEVSLDIEAISTSSADPAIQLTTFLGDAAQETLDVPLSNRVVNWPPNYRETVTLAKPADTISFTALGDTRFQLEGDTNNRQGSTFNVVRATNVVECGGASVGLENGASLSVGGDGCTDEPVVFEINEDGEVLLLKEPSEAEYTLSLPFEDNDDPLARVEIDYDNDGSSEYQNVNFCGGSTASPVLARDENPLTPATDASEWDGFCEAGRSYTIENGVFKVVVKLFGVNDPKFRFR